MAGAQAPVAPVVARRVSLRLGGNWLDRALSFGVGMAVAAALAFIVVVPRGEEMTDSVVASHIRALQPGHLMDVASTISIR